MKFNYALVISLFLIFSSVELTAQSNIIRCGTLESQQTNLETYHELKKASQINKTIRVDQVIPDTIHVVVHVLWSTSIMNIPDSMILKQLQILNEDFQRLNADTINTPVPFQALSGSLPVVFALAQYDTSGVPTTGIVRTQTAHGPFGFNTYFDMTHSSNGGDDKWNSHFMNIYCAEMSGSDGVGWMGSNICLISYQVFGNSRVGTHEMGHVFGLGHIWGPEQSTGGFICSSDDGIADTPEQWSPVNYCGPFPLYDTCTVSGNGIMYMNYMNYNYDWCINMFSVGQIGLMTTTLNTTLNDLINNVQLNTDENYLMKNISIYPNPNNGNFKLEIPENVKFELSIFNSLGQKVSDALRIIEGSNEIELSLKPGIYSCILKNDDFQIVKKIVLQ